MKKLTTIIFLSSVLRCGGRATRGSHSVSLCVQICGDRSTDTARSTCDEGNAARGVWTHGMNLSQATTKSSDGST